MKKILATAALLLCCPAAAAGAPIVPPVGTPAGPYTLEATDSWSQIGSRGSNMALPFDSTNGVVRTAAGALQWGSSGCIAVNQPGGPQIGGACTLVPGTIVTWQAKRFHRYRKTQPFLDVTLARFYAAESSEVIPTRANDQVAVHPEFDTPDCNATGDNEGWVVPWGPGPAGLAAGPDAPDDFAIACALPRPTSSGTGQVSQGTQGDDEKITAVAPATAFQRCGRVVPQRGRRAVVVARSVNCRSARNIIVRYARRGIEPRGWVCVTARSGRSRAATCARLQGGKARARQQATSAPRITARWRA